MPALGAFIQPPVIFFLVIPVEAGMTMDYA